MQRGSTLSGEPWVYVSGTVVPGHGVALRPGPESPYPRGTIELQRPHFRALGFDLGAYYPATLNVSIRPATFDPYSPELTLRQVAWTDLHPPEDFSFSRCRVGFGGRWYDGWIYYPHPETKVRHFQDPGLVEIVAPFIPGLAYGSAVEIALNPAEARLSAAEG